MVLFSHCKENNCAGNTLDKCSADKLIVYILHFTVELVEAVAVDIRSTNSPLSAHYEATGYCMLLSEAFLKRLCTLYNIALFERPKSCKYTTQSSRRKTNHFFPSLVWDRGEAIFFFQRKQIVVWDVREEQQRKASQQLRAGFKSNLLHIGAF